jgi:tRNA pseudouridine38-40 synthase
VHAAGQVVSSDDRRTDLTERQLLRAINANLPDDVAVTRVERVSGEFHARYDAKWREYRYRLWVGTRQPLAEAMVAQQHRTVDLRAMVVAANTLIGTHDFAAFAGGGEGVPWSDRQQAPRGSVRTLFCGEVRQIAPWWGAEPDAGELIELRVVADGFLPNMVRNIAGALLEIGTGKRTPGWIEELLEARDRRAAGKTAPANGLILWRVGYENESFLEPGRDARTGQ